MAREFKIKNFDKGLVNTIEDISIAENAASSSLNWITLGDTIELSGGYTVIGTEDASAGKVTGLKVLTQADGALQPWKTYGQKLEYYTTDWNESGTDLLGSDADGEDVAITGYTSLAGYQGWVSSPNSDLFKIMLANPDDSIAMYEDGINFRGYIHAEGGGLYLWNDLASSTNLRRSHLDPQDDAVYTDVTNEVLGAAGAQTYTGTLAAVTGTRTCFAVSIDDSGAQTVTDDRNGALSGDGTGTINYATGAYSVTFDANAGGQVQADYTWEDSKVDSLADFRFSDPRVALEGFFLNQPSGGDLQSVAFYQSDAYCLHETATWLAEVSSSDDAASNLIFRVNTGVENWRGAVADGDGIYFVDTSNPSEPRLKLLTLQRGGSERVEPLVVSFNVDLSGFDFDETATFRWGDYILWAVKTDGSAFNNRLFTFNKQWKSIDVLDYRVSVLDDYDGALWAGDSLSNNVYQLFTGFSAGDSLITNYWEGKLSQLEIDELKKFKRLTVKGQIGSDQNIKVSISYDDADFVEIGTILGTGSYVDEAASFVVGGPQVGENVIGGGGSGITAYDYVREFRVRSPKFDEAKIRIEAQDIGYASVTEINYQDIKTYGQKNVRRYRQTS